LCYCVIEQQSRSSLLCFRTSWWHCTICICSRAVCNHFCDAMASDVLMCYLVSPVSFVLCVMTRAEMAMPAPCPVFFQQL
jgi:hypothetical protein